MMSRLTTIAGVCVILASLASGCGSSDETQRSDDVVQQLSVVQADESVPESAIDAAEIREPAGCAHYSHGKGFEPGCESDELAGLPAEALDARIVAKLSLQPDRFEAIFITFESREKGRCFDVQVRPASSARVGPLTCAGNRTCEEICLSLYMPGGMPSVLGGVVSERAEVIRIQQRNGGSQQFDLASAPELEELNSMQIVMAASGSAFPQAIELLKDDDVIASEP